MSEKDSVSPEDNKKIRVLLVHQHTIVREGLRLLLEQCDSVTIVGEAETCEEAAESNPPWLPARS